MKAIFLIVISLLYFSSTMNAEENRTYAIAGINYLIPNTNNESFTCIDIELKEELSKYIVGFDYSILNGLDKASKMNFFSMRPSIGFYIYKSKSNKFKSVISTSSGLTFGRLNNNNIIGTFSKANLEFIYKKYSLIFSGNYIFTNIYSESFGSVGFRVYLK